MPKLEWRVRTLSGFEVVVIAGNPGLTADRVGDRQKGRISRAQLVAAGFSRRQLERACRDGRLRRVRRGVYALGHLAKVEHSREAEALLATGLDMALFGLSVLEFHGVIPPREDAVVHVASRLGRRPHAHPRIKVHYPSDLGHVVVRDGLPMTTVEQALADAAPHLTARELSKAVDEACYRRLTSRTKIRDVAAARVVPDLLALADPTRPSTRTESRYQETMLDLIRTARLPEPETEVELWGFRVDFLFRDSGVVLEVDPFSTHGNIRGNFNRDRRKDRVLTSHGLEVMRVSDEDIKDRAMEIIAQLSAAIARRLAER